MNSKMRDKTKIQAAIKLQRADRTALVDQEVTLRQTRHQFLFGNAAFDLVPLANDEYSGKEKEVALQKADRLLALFNTATLPFYWALFEPQRGNPRTAQLQRAARWCADHRLKVKGHPLCWHTLTADWLLSMNPADILREQLGRIRRDVADFRGSIEMWDVINEAVIMPVFDRYDNGITCLCRDMGRIRLIKTLFETVREINPAATLLINDFDTSPAYDILIEGCLEAGIRFDAIGIQSHMHQGYWGVEKTQEILERFGRFHLPIHFTETTLVSGQLMPPEIVDLNDYQVSDWPTTPAGEERQAREAVQYYKTLFAHPLVESITWWDLTDGHWLNAPAGLLRRDGSPKPAYDELLRLVKGEWWLPPTRLNTGPDGVVGFSGYPGEYELTLGNERRVFILDYAGSNELAFQFPA